MYDLPITSSDALALSHRRLMVARPLNKFKCMFPCTCTAYYSLGAMKMSDQRTRGLVDDIHLFSFK